VTFTGRADMALIAEVLSAADVGLCPDLKSPLNDVSTMNKTMEYMAYALPSVAFDLVETRVSGADSAVYVESGDVKGFADAVEALLKDPERRLAMGLKARARVSSVLDWGPQATAYVSVYKGLAGSDQAGGTPRQRDSVPYVDLDDQFELRRFIIERSAPPVDSTQEETAMQTT
jgi:glycosyltransferase involved in cell wall biosynthesis